VLLSGSEVFGPLSSRFLPDDIALRLVGIMVLLLGLSFAVWARVHLGQYWSGRVSIKVDHKLIRSGPYRLVRHPIYTGILFGFIGTALEVGEIRAWLAFVLALVGLLIKIRAEERLLVKEFGSTYLQYKKEVKMLIPYLV
jgi:protein-S-isoprenylcysteine O-methyltransferase Ste14